MSGRQMPRPPLEISKKRFSYVGAKVWNAIPNDIRKVESIHIFKQKIKPTSWDNKVKSI